MQKFRELLYPNNVFRALNKFWYMPNSLFLLVGTLSDPNSIRPTNKVIWLIEGRGTGWSMTTHFKTICWVVDKVWGDSRFHLLYLGRQLPLTWAPYWGDSCPKGREELLASNLFCFVSSFWLLYFYFLKIFFCYIILLL